MILTGPQIREEGIISPHVPKSIIRGVSYGESIAGYDIRLGQALGLVAGRTMLGVSLERFKMPLDVLGIVHDKSTWARRGVFVQNTVIDPGWEGFLTLEVTFNPLHERSVAPFISEGMPIAQIIFHRTERVTAGYSGKYQNQINQPVRAKYEEDI